MSTYYMPPREPRDRSRSADAKRRTLEMRAARRFKLAGVTL